MDEDISVAVPRRRRSSILKQQNKEINDQDVTCNLTRKVSRRVSFAEKRIVKEFDKDLGVEHEAMEEPIVTRADGETNFEDLFGINSSPKNVAQEQFVASSLNTDVAASVDPVAFLAVSAACPIPDLDISPRVKAMYNVADEGDLATLLNTSANQNLGFRDPSENIPVLNLENGWPISSLAIEGFPRSRRTIENAPLSLNHESGLRSMELTNLDVAGFISGIVSDNCSMDLDDCTVDVRKLMSQSRLYAHSDTRLSESMEFDSMTGADNDVECNGIVENDENAAGDPMLNATTGFFADLMKKDPVIALHATEQLFNELKSFQETHQPTVCGVDEVGIMNVQENLVDFTINFTEHKGFSAVQQVSTSHPATTNLQIVPCLMATDGVNMNKVASANGTAVVEPAKIVAPLVSSPSRLERPKSIVQENNIQPSPKSMKSRKNADSKTVSKHILTTNGHCDGAVASELADKCHVTLAENGMKTNGIASVNGQPILRSPLKQQNSTAEQEHVSTCSETTEGPSGQQDRAEKHSASEPWHLQLDPVWQDISIYTQSICDTEMILGEKGLDILGEFEAVSIGVRQQVLVECSKKLELAKRTLEDQVIDSLASFNRSDPALAKLIRDKTLNKLDASQSEIFQCCVYKAQEEWCNYRLKMISTLSDAYQVQIKDLVVVEEAANFNLDILKRLPELKSKKAQLKEELQALESTSAEHVKGYIDKDNRNNEIRLKIQSSRRKIDELTNERIRRKTTAIKSRISLLRKQREQNEKENAAKSTSTLLAAQNRQWLEFYERMATTVVHTDKCVIVSAWIFDLLFHKEVSCNTVSTSESSVKSFSCSLVTDATPDQRLLLTEIANLAQQSSSFAKLRAGNLPLPLIEVCRPMLHCIYQARKLYQNLYKLHLVSSGVSLHNSRLTLIVQNANLVLECELWFKFQWENFMKSLELLEVNANIGKCTAEKVRQLWYQMKSEVEKEDLSDEFLLDYVKTLKCKNSL